MKKRVLGLLCVVCCFGSCIVVNDTRGESRTCEVHHKRMHKAWVGTDFGLSAFGPDAQYPNAKDKLNVGCVRYPWPFRRIGIIYHCSVCDSIKNSK